MADKSEDATDLTAAQLLSEAFFRAHQQVLAASSQYGVTGNPVFMWNAIAAMTAPEIAGVAFSLPEPVREYLHTAALGVRSAAVGPPGNFDREVIKALSLTKERQGHSVPRHYSNIQSLELLLGVYAALKSKHGSPKAYGMIAKVQSIDVFTLRVKLTEGRKLVNRIRRAAGEDEITSSYIPDSLRDIHGDLLPDGALIGWFVEGAPETYWRRNGK